MNLYSIISYFTTLAQEEHYTKSSFKITYYQSFNARHSSEDELDVALLEKKRKKCCF